MAGERNYSAHRRDVCHVCKAGPLDKLQFVTHIMGKRHQKNLKNRSKSIRKSEMKRTLHVTGYKAETPVEAIVGTFYKYGVLNVMPFANYSFVEFKDADCVKDCLSDTHFIGEVKLKVSRRHQQASADTTQLQLSWNLRNELKQVRISPQSQWNTLQNLIKEIELKPMDYQLRERVRVDVENFLRPQFRQVSAQVFGSSNNKLGFNGCDVDLFVSLGLEKLEFGSKLEKEKLARSVTWQLARMLQNAGAQKVQAIARARVPIVKFQHPTTGLAVDMSFRNAMPIYNTQLICIFCDTHPLVRPYLMVIRYWSKLQDVAGGGQPTYLITNYGLTMLMLFYLMVRDQPIIPCVAELKSQCAPNVRRNHTIEGWDCSFGCNVNEWKHRRYDVSVLELVCEFFSYYGNFDSKNWVVSPLVGRLIPKELVNDRNVRKLPSCMSYYCSQETNLQLDTPICLQDPFEHCYNITRGLQSGPFAEFRYKCKKAAEICEGIIRGNKRLSHLFEEIPVDEDELSEMQSRDSPIPNEVDITIDEIITLDDSDISPGDQSQDEIEILDLVSKKEDVQQSSSKKDDASKTIEDSSVIEKIRGEMKIDDENDDSIEEVFNDDSNNDSSIEEIQDNDSIIEITKENGVTHTEDNKKRSRVESSDVIPEDSLDESSDIIPEDSKHALDESNDIIPEDNEHSLVEPSDVMPEKSVFKFLLDFSKIPEFTITFDGTISGSKKVLMSEDDIGQAACSLLHFILQQCFKMEVTPVENVSDGKKRKTSSPENAEKGKRMKNADGEGVRILMTYRKVAEYMCTTESQLWVGRKKVSKTVMTKLTQNPLQYEMAITEAQMCLDDDLIIGAGKLHLTVTLWQKVDNPASILVTGETLSNEKLTKSMMNPFFRYLSSLVPTLLEKIDMYIIKTSTKR